jgi:hypothetical protein
VVGGDIVNTRVVQIVKLAKEGGTEYGTHDIIIIDKRVLQLM